MAWPLAKQIARTILSGFERHYDLFQRVTAGAMARFEAADWRAVQQASRERIYYYDQRVNETIDQLREDARIGELDEVLWQRVKVEYVRLLHQHRQPELAETYYNSVFCRLFDRNYFNNRNIFVRPALSTEHIDDDVPAYRCVYPGRDGFARVIANLLLDFGFSVPFRDLRRDVRNLLRGLRQRQAEHAGPDQNFHLAVLNTPFFRNKAAYLIGKLVNGTEAIPFVVPVLNDEQRGLYVDTLLVGEHEIANVFSFARAYFMVDTPVPAAVVSFLERLLPSKTKAALYTALGLQKHGKTEFYRDFLHHLKFSGDDFVTAPGIRGMVMTVFTLPSYPYVFKVIKDRFPEPKDMTRDEVKAKYQLVKQHDRVGRMADSWEYSEAAFPLARFAPELLDELKRECAGSIEFEADRIIIDHVYIERRMVPLDLYIKRVDEAELRRVIKGYGNALRQLAGVDIFPGDMLLKNFGVTRNGRVVFYDYDEICYLHECRFRHIPQPPYPEFELSGEPWYSVAPHDIFPEEFATFMLSEPRVRRIFQELHGELLDADFWRERQAQLRNGSFEDVFPYPRSWRFHSPGGTPPPPVSLDRNTAAA